VIKLQPPISGVPYQKQRTILDGKEFQIEWKYNERTDSWTISLDAIGDATQEEPTPVLTGAKVFIGYDILRRCRHEMRPGGKLFCMSSDNTRRHPGRDDLASGRCCLIYFDEGEI
jgi:hypothetical protein